jgi:hypothetical protein
MTLTDPKYFFVVTRNKRRVEDKNYSNIHEAELRASKLKAALKEFDPNDVKNVIITKTKKPNQIR